MKKEVFLAIFIGFILGLIITFGIWTANKSLKQAASAHPSPTPPEEAAVSQTPSPSQTPASMTLNLTSPDDESLVSTTTVTLSGTTSPGASVALLYETGQTILVADTSGNFSSDIPLEGGYNRIIVTAYDQTGHTATKNLTVTYTTQKI